MSLTIEQIREGIAENAELKTQILTEFDSELPEYIKGKGFQVHSAEDYEKEFGKRLSPKLAELYTGVEKDVIESFGKYGVKKESNNEKVYDLIKKVPTVIDAKILDLETKLADALAGKGDDVTKAQIEAYKSQVAGLEKERDVLKTEYSQKELQFKVGRDFDNAFTELQITVPANVADKDKADYIKNKTSLLSQALSNKYQVKEENGNIVFTDSDGNVQMNGTNPATAKDLLTANFKYDFEPAKKEGSGSQGGQSSTPVRVQSKSELYAAVAKEGHTNGSKDWTKRVNELAKANGIDIAA